MIPASELRVVDATILNESTRFFKIHTGLLFHINLVQKAFALFGTRRRFDSSANGFVKIRKRKAFGIFVV